MPQTATELCSLAWGDQPGYVFLAVRDPAKTNKDKGYWKDLTFKWPGDRSRVEDALDKARTSRKDVYFCPNVFTEPHRSRDALSEITTLYADLDEVDPRDLPAYLTPTAAWETSPNRWQALWQLDRPLVPETQEELNQRLTYAIGADRGGWDLTQVLRIPDTHNHKYPNSPKVELLWLNGHTLNPITLVDDLPNVEATDVDRTPVGEVLDQSFVLSRVRVGAQATKLIRAKHPSGDRSATLWLLECLLAEKGLSAEEIVGVVLPTVWNKFAGRRDELRQLSSEARKAIDHVGSVTAQNGQVIETLEEVGDEVQPISWQAFDRQHEAVSWMVAELWGESEVGFISGHPKSYKSWLALDLAISVATGTRFLGAFATRRHNVLLIQEEDPKPILQERLSMVGASKGLVGWQDNGDSTFEMWYDIPDGLFIISNQGFTIDEDWLEQLEVWITTNDIRLVILDPLMMMGGNVDEFKAFEFMAGVLKPLKRLRAKTQTAIAIVHHHTKAAGSGIARDMYGSVALWAWEEAALHLQVTGTGRVVAERFSKHALLQPVTVEVGEIKEAWTPRVIVGGTKDVYDALTMVEVGTVKELQAFTNLGRDAVDRQLKDLEKQGRIEQSKRHQGEGRSITVWRVKE